MRIEIREEIDIPNIYTPVAKLAIDNGAPIEARAAWDGGINEYVLRVSFRDAENCWQDRTLDEITDEEAELVGLIREEYDDDWNWARLGSDGTRARSFVNEWVKEQWSLFPGLKLKVAV